MSYIRIINQDEVCIRKIEGLSSNYGFDNHSRMVFDKPTKYSYFLNDITKYRIEDEIENLIIPGDIIQFSCGPIKAFKKATEYDIIELKIKQYNLIRVMTAEEFENFSYQVKED